MMLAAVLAPLRAVRGPAWPAGARLGLAEIGEIAPGKVGDFVVVDGGPLTELRTVERPTLVLLGGRPIA